MNWILIWIILGINSLGKPAAIIQLVETFSTIEKCEEVGEKMMKNMETANKRLPLNNKYSYGCQKIPGAGK